MVANVWKVVVSAGDTVEDGDTLVILESMKMEIPVVAEASGKVTSLRGTEGDVVQEGAAIAGPEEGLGPLSGRSQAARIPPKGQAGAEVRRNTPRERADN